MKTRRPVIKVCFASGTDELNAKLITRIDAIIPELPLYVVSEFAPEHSDCIWVRYYPGRHLENFGRCRAAFLGKRIRIAAVLLVPNVPFHFMRLMAFLLAPLRFLAVNENLDNFFLLRPASLPKIVGHVCWRASNYLHERRETERMTPHSQEQAMIPAEPAVECFAGRAESGKPRILVACPYLPFPLAHGGAVRIFNLMTGAAAHVDQILIVFVDQMCPPPAELLHTCVEIVIVQRIGTHNPRSSGRPEMVEEFASEIFEEALRAAVARWRPAIAQLEFTQMAQYAGACAPARTILVEHDITFDLYDQMALKDPGWDRKLQAKRWRSFERKAWTKIERIVVMSEQDRKMVGHSHARVLSNGVDLERFQPTAVEPEARRVLFIGSFAHLPNLTAVDFFLRKAWPLIRDCRLHIIAGPRPEYFLEFFRSEVRPPLDSDGVELEGFVSDVRPAYERAAVVVVPVVTSAGTNIKVLEAMALGKAIVSTPAGVNGIDLTAGEEYLCARDGDEMASAIETIFREPGLGARLGAAARRRAEREFGWDSIARRQSEIYNELLRA